MLSRQEVHHSSIWIPTKSNTYNFPDGYTVMDVVMYWKPTPVRGVEGAELPQFTILGYETNDRKVWSYKNKNAAGFNYQTKRLFSGNPSHRNLPAPLAIF